MKWTNPFHDLSYSFDKVIRNLKTFHSHREWTEEKLPAFEKTNNLF